MKALIALSLLFATNAIASSRFGKCTKEEFNRGCYHTIDAWCDPWHVTDACVFQCACEPEPVKRYPVCTYRTQDGYEYMSSGTTQEEACARAKDLCESHAANICTRVSPAL